MFPVFPGTRPCSRLPVIEDEQRDLKHYIFFVAFFHYSFVLINLLSAKYLWSRDRFDLGGCTARAGIHMSPAEAHALAELRLCHKLDHYAGHGGRERR